MFKEIVDSLYGRGVVSVARDYGMSIRKLTGVSRVIWMGCGMARLEIGTGTDLCPVDVEVFLIPELGLLVDC